MDEAIMQQFCDNHGSLYTVIGIFETKQEAQKAYDRWEKLTEAVAVWQLQNSKAKEAHQQTHETTDEYHPLPLPEIVEYFSENYGEDSFRNFIHRVSPLETITEHLQLWDRYLFIADYHGQLPPEEPLVKNFLKALGATATPSQMDNVGAWAGLVCHITLKLPSAKAAYTLQQTVEGWRTVTPADRIKERRLLGDVQFDLPWVRHLSRLDKIKYQTNFLKVATSNDQLVIKTMFPSNLLVGLSAMLRWFQEKEATLSNLQYGNQWCVFRADFKAPNTSMAERLAVIFAESQRSKILTERPWRANLPASFNPDYLKFSNPAWVDMAGTKTRLVFQNDGKNFTLLITTKDMSYDASLLKNYVVNQMGCSHWQRYPVDYLEHFPEDDGTITN